MRNLDINTMEGMRHFRWRQEKKQTALTNAYIVLVETFDTA